uniref:NADH-ubiquinone oxidoreductase chain 2 n=1 Tax=Scrobicularia plana TaxID=665965 RepID=A0A6H2U253_9BIVA|nr:NADH dehydrogenase subunit 2 [Scrobicularia plana]
MVMPSFVIFVLISLMGTFFVVFSSGILGLWISLEVGFFGFIPVLNGKTVGENEAASKYFVVQGVGSGLMLVSFLLINSTAWLSFSLLLTDFFFYFCLLLGFMIKLGVFPFHFWFPGVMGGASWFSCFWLSVTQKVGPFWGISGLGLTSWVLESALFFLIMTSVVGGFGGLAQTQFRPLLAYSSLGQTGWMGLVCLLSLKVFVLYMILYSVLLSGLLSVLHMINSYSIYNVPGSLSSKGVFFWLFSGGFFVSLSGIPPFAGCALKLAGIMTIIGSYPLYLTVLIMTSMVSLYFYLSMFISSVICLSDSKYNFYTSFLPTSGVLLPTSLNCFI